jgi:hypothetical protein
MREQVHKATKQSMIWTSLVWFMLIVMGLLVVGVTSSYGLEAVADIVNHLKHYSVAFSLLFWTAATAAIFSTADSQIYSFLLVESFDPRTGTSCDTPRYVSFPLWTSAIIAMVFTSVFALVDISQFPFEPIVFFVFPIFLCLVPAIVEYFIRGECSLTPILIGLGLYMACGLGMVLLPNYSFPLSLAAPLMPGLVSGVVYLVYKADLGA